MNKKTLGKNLGEIVDQKYEDHEHDKKCGIKIRR